MSPDVKALIDLIQSQLNSQTLLLWAQLILLLFYTGATFFLVLIGWKQLKKLDRDLECRRKDEKKWATVRACERLDTDSTFDGFNQRIFDKSTSKGDGVIDYTFANMKPLEADIKGLLNCFDALAIGVLENVYREDIIKDHYETTIKCAVNAFLLCKNEDNEDDKIIADRPVVKKEDYSSLMKLYEKWESTTSKPRS